ncbi:MAG: nitroreductase family protein [Bifidobacteriaceae bacterium]|jgi:nitroreductase|nr:nitroreductase family protein [Bifidobacteriaceae bacterium]
MTNVLEAIKNRYTCRKYTDQKLTDDQIKKLVDAALQAPTAMNAQAFQLIAVTNPEVLAKLETSGYAVLPAEVKQRMDQRGGTLLYNAPAIFYIMVDRKTHPVFADLDAGIIVENLALAAQSLGLGSTIFGMGRFPLQSSEAQALIKELQIKDGFEFSISCLVGYSALPPTPHAVDYAKVTYIS